MFGSFVKAVRGSLRRFLHSGVRTTPVSRTKILHDYGFGSIFVQRGDAGVCKISTRCSRVPFFVSAPLLLLLVPSWSAKACKINARSRHETPRDKIPARAWGINVGMYMAFTCARDGCLLCEHQHPDSYGYYNHYPIIIIIIVDSFIITAISLLSSAPLLLLIVVIITTMIKVLITTSS